MEQQFIIDFVTETFERIDKLLVSHAPAHSRSYWQKMIRTGLVYVDGVPVDKVNTKLPVGARIQVLPYEEETLDLTPENIPLDIVYQDDDIVIVNKAVGMVVHPGFGHQTHTLVHALLYHVKDLSSINGVVRPGIVHRIDKDTSGLIMIAKNDAAHLFLSQQLKDKTLYREYIALVHGEIADDRFTVDLPIGRHVRERTKMMIDEYGKPARTHIEVIRRFPNYTLVRARLETGRTHQIRVHLQSVGFPLVGDGVYTNRRNPFGLEGQFLHAYKLGFIHPRTKEQQQFTAPLPPLFQQILDTLKQDE
jgi:23S rRNA pseudouridine1911/1915/1917 synthase